VTLATTTTSVTATQFQESWGGAGLAVTVTVTAAAGSTAAPTGGFTVTDGSKQCGNQLTVPASGLTSTGTCNLNDLSPATYALVATYGGDSASAGSSSAKSPVTVTRPTNLAPSWTADSPPSSATSGQGYYYQFQASGTPAVDYTLCGCSANWLSINANGQLYGKVPYGISSFSYEVIASNTAGTIYSKVTVWVSGGHQYSDVSTQLSCTSHVSAGRNGTCTLYVTNDGWQQSSDVNAQIALPKQLRADYCNSGWWGWGYGCSISGNVASESLGTLNAGQTKQFTVTFTAGRPGWNWSWGWNSHRPETVTVTGSASTNNGWGWYQRNSYSTAHVTIYPQRWWW